MANEPQVFVFAYGSNLCTQRMRSRVSTATPLTIGCVRQRKFVFRKRSVDGSAKADAAFTSSSDDRVWGVVYQLHLHQKPLLDRHEFLGIGYDEELVEVVHEDRAIRAWMYLARHNAIDATLLPKPYVDYLRNFDSVVDPDAARHSVNRRLIRE